MPITVSELLFPISKLSHHLQKLLKKLARFWLGKQSLFFNQLSFGSFNEGVNRKATLLYVGGGAIYKGEVY